MAPTVGQRGQPGVSFFEPGRENPRSGGRAQAFLQPVGKGGALAALSAGCLPDLPLAQQIEDTRVIGARLEVMGAPERAWPTPGESARVTWLVVDPTDAAPVGWGLFVCPAVIAPNAFT